MIPDTVTGPVESVIVSNNVLRRGCGPSGDMLVVANGGSGVELERAVIMGNTFHSPTARWGMNLRNTRHVTIVGNQLHIDPAGSINLGIYYSSSAESAIVQGNTLVGPGMTIKTPQKPSHVSTGNVILP